MKVRAAIASLLLAITVTCAAARDSWTGKVVGVADGDTITVLRDKTPVKIRLHGVDAPEKAQPFGEKAKQLTSSLVFGKDVRVEVVTRDKYGRTVGRVYVVNPPACLEEELVKAGLAWWYRQYSAKDKKLAQLEEEARKAKRGLWADPNPTPPWEWRHGGKAATTGDTCRSDADCVLDYSVTLTDPNDPCSCSRCGRHHPRAVSRTAAAKPPSKPCAPRPCPACLVEPPPPLKAVCKNGNCAAVEVRSSPAPTASGPYHGNTGAKVFHAPECKDFTCKHCTAVFGSQEEAVKAGYRAHAVCVSGTGTPPPAGPSSKERACRADGDCVLLPLNSMCSCPPCGRVVRRAVNRTTYNAMMFTWARRRCRAPVCPACAPQVVGDKAVCIKGQCEVR
jgi:endonuclease YncB( thermonuclease family)